MLIPLISTLLVIISAFTWVAINSTILSYQSTAVDQQTSQQIVLAEFSLTQAENWLQYNASTQLPKPVTHCLQQPCILIAQAASHLPQQSASWWQDKNNLAVIATHMNIPSTHSSYYAIEELVESATPKERYFRITSWALLTTQSIPCVLQSLWEKSEGDQRSAWREWK